jgi:hypothetical protein
MRQNWALLTRQFDHPIVVNLTGKSAMRSRSQQFNPAIVVSYAGLSDREISATTKPQRADQASLDRTRVRLRLSQQFSAGAPRHMQPFSRVERLYSGVDASGRQTNYRCSERPSAVAELHR